MEKQARKENLLATPIMAQTNRKHILAVDDNADLLATLRELLNILGHTYLDVRNARDAMDAIEGDEQFDVLLTDITLPGMSGIDLAKNAVRLRPSIAVVFSSGFGDISPDAVNFPFLSLPKPYTLNQLQEVLAMVTGRSL
jgi:DNA-binding NtrC family response regulator